MPWQAPSLNESPRLLRKTQNGKREIETLPWRCFDGALLLMLQFQIFSLLRPPNSNPILQGLKALRRHWARRSSFFRSLFPSRLGDLTKLALWLCRKTTSTLVDFWGLACLQPWDPRPCSLLSCPPFSLCYSSSQGQSFLLF